MRQITPSQIRRERLAVVEEDIRLMLGQKQASVQRLMQLRTRNSELITEQDYLVVARDLYQKAAILVRYKVSDRFAELATEALRYIYQRDDLTFIVGLDVKGNMPVATFKVQIGDHEADPRTSMGGSIFEIIGVCLRLICLEVFEISGPLILDEPLRSVDDANLQRVLAFIQHYCNTAKRQLIIVTHNNQIANTSDKLFEVTQQNGISVVVECI